MSEKFFESFKGFGQENPMSFLWLVTLAVIIAIVLLAVGWLWMVRKRLKVKEPQIEKTT